MVDTASIAIAVISLATSIGVAVASGIVTIYSDDRKARRETDRLLRKYRDPLLLAAQDLQSRIYNITERRILTFLHGSQDHKDCLIIYTAFLFGQYLCWTQILRQQAQFACFATEDHGRTKQLVGILGRIQACLNTDRWEGENPFMLWKGHQLAIGEIMTVVREDSDEEPEPLCMGFAEFTRKWKAGGGEEGRDHRPADSGTRDDNAAFRAWFSNIEYGIYEIEGQRQRGNPTGLNRLRRLQHLLLELINILDPEGARVEASFSKPASAAPHCGCSRCESSSPKNAQRS